MTLSKRRPKGGSEAREAAAAAADDDESAAVEESTPYKGSRCCVGFFQCHVCGHEWSSVYSWANSSQSCKPCSSRRRQTWVLPYRQIPKSRKYEFFCVDCDQYIAESYRARDAHQGIACKTCEALVFPDWEFPCDQCNIVHLYSFSKTEAMRGIDCDCGGFLFPKHMKSLNKKHESRYCQKCRELGVNCCNFKAPKEEPKAEMTTTTTIKAKEPAGRPKKKPVQKRPAPRPRVSESSVEERGGAERKANATTRKSAPKQRQRASVSSVEGEAPAAAAGKKPARRPAPKQRQQQQQRVSVSSVEVEPVEKKPSRRPAGKAARTGGGGGGGDFSEARENIPPKSRPSAARGGKKTTQRVATVVVVDENAPVRSANRGGRSAPRGGGPKSRNHVYADEDVLRAAPTPKNSVAVDPGIAEKPARKPGKPRAQRQRPRNAANAGRNGAKNGVSDAEVDALADQVAESIIISATRDVEAKAAPRQQKDENDNNIKVDDNNNDNESNNNNEEKRFVLVPAAESVSPKPKANAVELKGGHPPAVKVGGRRRVSSGRKSESEGKKPAAEAQSAEAVAHGDAVVAAAAAAPSDDKLAEADPEKSQVQLAAKSRMAVNHSEVSAVPEKPFPTKDVNSKIANVHPHYPTNKHPIQQPRKC